MAKLFVEMPKPRKAKFGFNCNVNLNSLEQLADAKRFIETQDPSQSFIEYVSGSYGGSDVVKVYSDDGNVVSEFKSKFCS